MMINGQNRTISWRIVQLREVVQVKQHLNGCSFLSCSQDRSSCADPSRNHTLEVQIVRFMGKSFVIIVLDVITSDLSCESLSLFVDVSLHQSASSEKRWYDANCPQISWWLVSYCILLPPISSVCLLLHPSVQKRSNVDCESLSYPSILVLLTFDA